MTLSTDFPENVPFKKKKINKFAEKFEDLEVS